MAQGNLYLQYRPSLIPKFYHEKGALAAARLGDQMNPKRIKWKSVLYCARLPYLQAEVESLKDSNQAKLMEVWHKCTVVDSIRPCLTLWIKLVPQAIEQPTKPRWFHLLHVLKKSPVKNHQSPNPEKIKHTQLLAEPLCHIWMVSTPFSEKLFRVLMLLIRLPLLQRSGRSPNRRCAWRWQLKDETLANREAIRIQIPEVVPETSIEKDSFIANAALGLHKPRWRLHCYYQNGVWWDDRHTLWWDPRAQRELHWISARWILWRHIVSSGNQKLHDQVVIPTRRTRSIRSLVQVVGLYYSRRV